MKTAIPTLGAALLFGLILPVANAQEPDKTSTETHHAPAAPTQAIDVSSAAQDPVAIVETFDEALAAGDFATVETMLAPQVIVLESGGAERSRDEYLGHHARADAKYLAGFHSALMRRTARAVGDTAWVASESELHALTDGTPSTMLSTETMVLAKTGDGWRIVHIHWSSRVKKEG